MGIMILDSQGSVVSINVGKMEAEQFCAEADTQPS